jgi:hypothetical protein
MPKPKKNKKGKSVKSTFRIFCEGKKTEPYYLKGYIDSYHSDNRRLLVIEDTKKNTPVQLVEAAISHRASGNSSDIYWVVFDREATTKYSHELHLEARNTAKDNNIQIAFTNVCIEFWFLLHFDYTAAGYDSCKDLLKRSLLKKKLAQRGIDNYDKGFAYLFDRLKQNQGITKALFNGQKCKKQALDAAQPGKASPCFLNPYTDVHELLIDMKRFVENQPSIRARGLTVDIEQELATMRDFINAKDGI